MQTLPFLTTTTLPADARASGLPARRDQTGEGFAAVFQAESQDRAEEDSIATEAEPRTAEAPEEIDGSDVTARDDTGRGDPDAAPRDIDEPGSPADQATATRPADTGPQLSGAAPLVTEPGRAPMPIGQADKPAVQLGRQIAGGDGNSIRVPSAVPPNAPPAVLHSGPHSGALRTNPDPGLQVIRSEAPSAPPAGLPAPRPGAGALAMAVGSGKGVTAQASPAHQSVPSGNSPSGENGRVPISTHTAPAPEAGTVKAPSPRQPVQDARQAARLSDRLAQVSSPAPSATSAISASGRAIPGHDRIAPAPGTSVPASDRAAATTGPAETRPRPAAPAPIGPDQPQPVAPRSRADRALAGRDAALPQEPATGSAAPRDLPAGTGAAQAPARTPAAAERRDQTHAARRDAPPVSAPENAAVKAPGIAPGANPGTRRAGPAGPASAPAVALGAVFQASGTAAEPAGSVPFIETEGALPAPVTLSGADSVPPLARPERITRAPPVPVARQVAEALVGRGEGDIIEITLDPPELGRVRMALSEGAGTMTITIQADSQATSELMRRHQELLRQDFQDLGYEQVSFAFEQGGDRDHGAPGSDGRQAALSAPAEGHDGDALPEDAAAPGPRGIDIRI